MRQIIVFFLFVPFLSTAQLTVDKIMQNPKWIGTSPSNMVWSYDSRSVFFQWNPDKEISDSTYSYSLSEHKISKAGYAKGQLAEDIANGVYNKARTMIAFIHNNDVYTLTVAGGKLVRITQTESAEENVRFANRDSDVVYLLNDNVYSWNLYSGVTKQLTNFIKTPPPTAAHDDRQEKWLANEALQTSAVLKRRSDNGITGF